MSWSELWRTPHHPNASPLTLRERYVGLRGQTRLCFVDAQGRVWHYDEDEVTWAGMTGTFRIVTINKAWEREMRRSIRGTRPRTLAELKARRGPRCSRCRRRNFMGRPLHKMGSGCMACIDCFCFLTGIDARDPVEDATARSGSGQYVEQPRRMVDVL